MTKPAAPVIVVDYDPNWPEQFASLRAWISPALGDLAEAIEHIGSTAVPGLAAKPIIDIDVVIADRAMLPLVIERLAAIGYRHEGDLGIPGREAFSPPDGSIPHHLYVCDRQNDALREHLQLRDSLRLNPDAAQDYGDLKRRLAVTHRLDRRGYTDAKTAWIRGHLAGPHSPADALNPS